MENIGSLRKETLDSLLVQCVRDHTYELGQHAEEIIKAGADVNQIVRITWWDKGKKESTLLTLAVQMYLNEETPVVFDLLKHGVTEPWDGEYFRHHPLAPVFLYSSSAIPGEHDMLTQRMEDSYLALSEAGYSLNEVIEKGFNPLQEMIQHQIAAWCYGYNNRSDIVRYQLKLLREAIGDDALRKLQSMPLTTTSGSKHDEHTFTGLPMAVVLHPHPSQGKEAQIPVVEFALELLAVGVEMTDGDRGVLDELCRQLDARPGGAAKAPKWRDRLREAELVSTAVNASRRMGSTPAVTTRRRM